MSSQDSVFVIPPYLLNTCYGLELQENLYWADPELARTNQFCPLSSGYYLRLPQDLSYPTNSFSNDPVIDEIIKRKLTQKFSVMGILGHSPPTSVPDSYLFELYEIFRSRLGPGSADSEECLASAEHVEKCLRLLRENRLASASSPVGGPHAENWGYPQPASPTRSSSKSVFDIKNYGEVTFHDSATNEKLALLENLPLDALFAWTRKNREHKYFYSPYLMHKGSYKYLFRLPMYWCPLTIDKDLQLLENGYGLDSALEDGCAVLRLKLNEHAKSEDSPKKKRFFNFVANAEIPSSTGVFYYEVVIEQTASLSTLFQPIIYANDSSISSGSSLLFNMGFSKRFVKFDKIPSSSSSQSASSQSIDLKSLLFKLSQSETTATEANFNDDTLAFLGAEPGVSLEGSLAISFNNSCSYASTKSGDSTYRSSSLNLNRRISQLNRHNQNEQEASKLDIDAPFNIHSKSGESGKKFFKSDVVGFGVNFITKTMFITLNGILVKSISDEEIVSSNKYKDSIFDSLEEASSLFPIIGFQLSDLLGHVQEGEVPESKITTNFGLMPFLFNIDGYVKALKDEQRAILLSSVSDEIKSVSLDDSAPDFPCERKFEKSVCNINNNPDTLNDLIKGFLVQGVYMKSLEALNSDLAELANNTNSEISNELDELVQKSSARERLHLKNLITNHEFTEAMQFIEEKFDTLPEKDTFKFELDLSNLIKLLRRHLYEETAGENPKLRVEILQCSKLMLSQAKFNPDFSGLIGELSGVLLLKHRDDLVDLPEAKYLIENFEDDTDLLADHINQAISKLLGLKGESKLQEMVRKVGENIRTLSLTEEPFKMINYEKDYIEL